MKALLAAAILFPITFLIFSYLLEDSSVSIKNGKNNFESNLKYPIECQYNTNEESANLEVCPCPITQPK